MPDALYGVGATVGVGVEVGMAVGIEVGDGVTGGASLGNSKGGLMPPVGWGGVERVSVLFVFSAACPLVGVGVGEGKCFLTSSSSEVTF